MIKDTDEQIKRYKSKVQKAFQSRSFCPNTTVPGYRCVHHYRSSPNPILLGFLWTLRHIGIIYHGLNLQAPFLSQRMVGGAESSNLLIRPLPQAIREPTNSCLIWTKDISITQEILGDLGAMCETHLSGNYKGLRSCVRNTGSKTKY